MINRYDTFSRLKKVILGKINFSLADTVTDENERLILKDILYQIDDTLKQIEKIFLDFGVEVHRPKEIIYDKNKSYRTPYIDLIAVKSCLDSADNFLVLKNCAVEMASVDPNTYFDYMQYQHIWNEQFDNGGRWISMPRPTYANNLTQKFPGNIEPLADSPAFIPYGQHIFHSEKNVINKKGLNWIKREFPGFNYIEVKDTLGHLDGYLSIIKPGLALSGLPKSKLPAVFQTWEVLELQKDDYKDVKYITGLIQDNDYENTFLSVNTFSIDHENLMMFEHVVNNYPALVKDIEKHKVNIIPVKYDVVKWINHGLSCICNAIEREGKFINYIDN